MATLQDIADRAEVAVSTVSRVLNGRPEARVTDEVRKRILAVADDLGYRPNAYARGLANGRGGQIVLAFWSASSHYSARRVAAIEQSLRHGQRPVMSIDAASVPRGPGPLLDLLGTQLPDAIVLIGGSFTADEMAEVVSHLHSRRVRCIVADLPWDVPADAPCDTVRADRDQGAALQMNHLLDLGHRHIGFVSLTNLTGRLAGYERALEAGSISERYIAPLDPAVQYGNYPLLGPLARSQTREMLERNPQVTALVCGTDVLALAAMQGLQELGLGVPDDLSVVGYDNDVWTEFLPVPLTTVEHPLDDISHEVKRILAARLGGDESPWQRVALDYRLIDRASTGRPRGRR
jgi:LacI family transcriptional regulator